MSEFYSPESRLMNKDSDSFRNSGAYTSPGTPDYNDNFNNQGRGFQKGWYSERVPLSNNSKQRRTSVNVLIPFSNGRTMPSKWDDAERWITSPVSGSGFGYGFGVNKMLGPPPQRRPKSKSGPLGPSPGDSYFSGYSPGFPLLEGGTTKNVSAGSPLTTGVLVPNGYSFQDGGGIDENSARDNNDYRLAPSQLFIESSYPDSQDEKTDENVSHVVSRRDMATQMSPVDSPVSSPKGRPLLSTSPPPIPSPVGPKSHRSARLEVRDVQVDKRVTMIKIPKKQAKKMEKYRSTEIKDLALAWNPTEGAMESSKLQKEEARIAAWENLQNAKAEASIRKLEMKLEKKKSASMDKIMKKLRNAQIKAQDMRKSVSGSDASQAPRTTRNFMSLRRYPKIALTCFFSSHHS